MLILCRSYNSGLDWAQCNFGLQESVFDVVPLFESCPVEDIEPINTYISGEMMQYKEKNVTFILYS